MVAFRIINVFVGYQFLVFSASQQEVVYVAVTGHVVSTYQGIQSYLVVCIEKVIGDLCLRLFYLYGEGDGDVALLDFGIFRGDFVDACCSHKEATAKENGEVSPDNSMFHRN